MLLPEFITSKKEKTKRRNGELFREGQEQFYRLRDIAVTAMRQHVLPWVQTGQIYIVDTVAYLKLAEPLVVVCSNGHRYRFGDFVSTGKSQYMPGCPMCHSTLWEIENEEQHPYYTYWNSFNLCAEWDESHYFDPKLGECPLHSFNPSIPCRCCGSSNGVTIIVTLCKDEARRRDEQFFASICGDIRMTISHPCLDIVGKDIEQEWQPLLIRCRSCSAPL